jgi:hypothetical protein
MVELNQLLLVVQYMLCQLNVAWLFGMLASAHFFAGSHNVQLAVVDTVSSLWGTSCPQFAACKCISGSCCC